MRKFYIIPIILQIFFCSAKSQSIQFKCYLKSNCDTSYITLDNYTIKKKDFAYYSLNSGTTAALPDTGFYILSSPKIAEDSLVIYINRYGLNTDTVKQKDINEVVFIDTKPPNGLKNGSWLCCDQRCEGYKIDYYTNGNKSMEGNFKKGRPIGVFKFYYSTGELNCITHYNRKGKIVNKEIIK